MNNVTIGGMLANATPFAYYETIAGGMGASRESDGPSGVQVHMTNTLNTPVEALELAYPFRLGTSRCAATAAGPVFTAGATALCANT